MQYDSENIIFSNLFPVLARRHVLYFFEYADESRHIVEACPVRHLFHTDGGIVLHQGLSLVDPAAVDIVQ